MRATMVLEEQTGSDRRNRVKVMAHAAKEMTAIREREIMPICDHIAGIIRRHLPEQSFRILLFGSWATLTSVPTSDIDVGILGDGPVAPLTMAQIREEVERLPTLRKVDVVDLWTVEERFRRSVMKQVEVLG